MDTGFFPLGVDTGFFHWGVVTRDGYWIFPLGEGGGGGVTRGGYGIFPLGGGGLRNHQVQRTTITTCVFISTIADFRSGRNCNTPK